MTKIEDLEFNNWKPVSEDFLYENFINDPVMTVEEKKLIEIDPSKIYFCKTPFDRYYYKQKYPLFDDELCIILEKCSIEKSNSSLPPIKEEKEENDKKPLKKNGFTVEKKNFIVDFN